MAYSFIETSTGNVLAHGDFDFTNDPRYDALIHTVRSDAPEFLIPFNPTKDEQYHVWNSSNNTYSLSSVTTSEKKEFEAKDDAGVIIKGEDGKFYKIIVDISGQLKAEEII